MPAQASSRLFILLFFLAIRSDGLSAEPTPTPLRDPWTDVLSKTDDQLPAFRDIAFDTFDTAKSLPQAEDLQQWFDVIAGQPQGIFETKTRRGQSAGIEGICRLKSPWPDDGAFKFALEDYNRLQIHFFRGDTGVTLVYHENELFRWSAYITRRQPKAVTPSQWTLAATDGDRNRRTFPKNHDHYELRCIQGEVVLSRGDVVLLRAPLAGPPDDVYFQGKGAFHGITLVRARDFPLPSSQKDNNKTIRPVDVAWLQHLDEGAKTQLQPDGGIRLSSPERPKKRSWCATSLPRDYPAELLLEIDEASPGAGIYLGNAKDGPRYVLRYARDRRSKLLCLLVRHDDDLYEHEFRGLTEFPLPVVQPHHWLRLVFGAGQLRWWISPDGIHWAEPSEPIRNLPPEVTHLGLHCVSRQGACSITLRKVAVRELTHLAELAPAELRAQAVGRPAAPSVGAWLADITELTPPGADTNAWRRACAWKTIAAGCSRPVANELLLLLLQDPFTRQLPLDQQLRVFADVALLIDVWDDTGALQKYLQRFVQAGQEGWMRDSTSPFSSIRHAVMTTPLATPHPLEIGTDELLRAEILQLAHTRDWDRLRNFAHELRFFQLQTKTPLLDWAESLALRKLQVASPASGVLNKQKDEWRDLLIEELHKDVYNAMAQLRVELSGAGRDDAARAIAGFDQLLARGIAPHWRDDQRLVALPTAVTEVLREDPALCDVLAQKYAEVARLRLRQAFDQLDAESVGMIAWQFAPTESAVDARVWLGDQALASGWFSKAVAEYRAATKAVSPGLQTAVAPRLRLAATLAGQDPGPPITGTVALGTVRQPAGEFEKLIKELATRQSVDTNRRVIDVGQNLVSIPKPAAYQVQRRARLDGPIGNDPNREFAKDIGRRQLDWVDRQLAIVVEGNWMFACNRFQVAAYDLQSKQRAWQTSPPPGQMQFAQESPFIASRPLVTRDRIWVRLLYGSGGTFACLDRANGQFVWTTAAPSNDEFISDPFFLGDELMCLMLARTEQQEAIVRLVSFDPRTGYKWREQEVVRLRDWWHRRRCCEMTMLDDGCIAHFGGVVVRLDSASRVLWLRKQITLPPDEDSQWVTQWFQPPVVAGDKVVVWQPGCRVLDCLDRETGSVLWSKLSLELERLIGIVNSNLITQTSRGLAAFQLDDGRTSWTLDLEGLTVGVTSSNSGGILAVQRLPTDASRSRFRPRLIWIDPTTGELRSATPLADLEEADPRIGPLVIDQDRIWTFWGRGQNDATRDVIELTPGGMIELLTSSLSTDIWARNVDSRLTEAAGTVLSQWQLLHGEFGERGGLLPEVHGEKDAVGIRFRNSGPIVLGRPVAFPASSRAQLRIRFGNEPAQPWRLEVRFGGEVIWTQPITAESHPQPWKNFAINLPQLAGREGWLTVRAYLPQGGDAPAYWKLLELVL